RDESLVRSTDMPGPLASGAPISNRSDPVPNDGRGGDPSHVVADGTHRPTTFRMACAGAIAHRIRGGMNSRLTAAGASRRILLRRCSPGALHHGVHARQSQLQDRELAIDRAEARRDAL